MNNKLIVHGTEIAVTTIDDKDYISLTDMLKAKDGDFFISDWLRNRNTVEFLGIWEQIHNPDFNYGEFAAIRSQAGLNSYKLSVKEWVEKTHAIGPVSYTHLDVYKRQEKMNVSTPYIAKIETGKQTGPVELAVEFAAFFDVSLDYLLVGKGDFAEEQKRGLP